MGSSPLPPPLSDCCYAVGGLPLGDDPYLLLVLSLHLGDLPACTDLVFTLLLYLGGQDLSKCTSQGGLVERCLATLGTCQSVLIRGIASFQGRICTSHRLIREVASVQRICTKVV